jgi:hypothetical protein
VNASLPPGPRGPARLQAVRFGRDPAGFLRQCVADHGSPFTLRLPNGLPILATAR